MSLVNTKKGEGDRKFTPDVSRQFIDQIVSSSDRAKKLSATCIDAMLSTHPATLGYPGPDSLSQYYIGADGITSGEISIVGALMEKKGLEQENTRIKKVASTDSDDGTRFEILQAAVESDESPTYVGTKNNVNAWLVRGDHQEDLKRVVECLDHAVDLVSNDLQKKSITHTKKSFVTGNMADYREAMKAWVQDKSPAVEAIFGFVEPYRDPFGTRTEFEGIVTLKDAEASKALEELVASAQQFIARLPWVTPTLDHDNGPFENSKFDAPTFTSSSNR